MEENEKKKPPEKYVRGKYSVKQKEATDRWNKNNYDSFTLRIKKGFRPRIVLVAQKQGISFNAFCVDAILRRIDEVAPEVLEMELPDIDNSDNSSE